ncbi:hypothetical protein DL96DRAFT_1605567 [Flagelloscypha sp. PMI_526]|nr:hypothetical protein DL96DRAFT_1605567 [Flagelloscypha sp. PMI_526]
MRRSGHPLGFIDRLAAPSYPNRWSRLLSLTPITVTSSMNLLELIPDDAPVKNLKKKRKHHRDTEPNTLTIEKLLFEQNRMLYRLIAPSQSFHRKLLANALGIPLALIQPFVQICAITFDEPRVIVKSWEQRIQSPRVAGFGWAETNMKCPLEFDAQRSLYMTPKESMLAPVGPERTEAKVQPLSSIKEFFASKLCDNQAPNPTLLLTYHKMKVLKVFETWGMDVLWKHDFNDLLLPLLVSLRLFISFLHSLYD